MPDKLRDRTHVGAAFDVKRNERGSQVVKTKRLEEDAFLQKSLLQFLETREKLSRLAGVPDAVTKNVLRSSGIDMIAS